MSKTQNKEWNGRLNKPLPLPTLNPKPETHESLRLLYSKKQQEVGFGESTPFIEFMLGEILATLEKHKGEEKPQIGNNIFPVDREFGIIFGNEFGIKFGIKFGDNDKKVLLLLNSNPTYSSQRIADRLEITKRAVEKIIQRLREANIIERIGSNKSGYWKVNRMK